MKTDHSLQLNLNKPHKNRISVFAFKWLIKLLKERKMFFVALSFVKISKKIMSQKSVCKDSKKCSFLFLPNKKIIG